MTTESLAVGTLVQVESLYFSGMPVGVITEIELVYEWDEDKYVLLNAVIKVKTYSKGRDRPRITDSEGFLTVSHHEVRSIENNKTLKKRYSREFWETFWEV